MVLYAQYKCANFLLVFSFLASLTLSYIDISQQVGTCGHLSLGDMNTYISEPLV